MAYHKLGQLLWFVDDANRRACQKMLADNLALFATAQGSVHNHQAWPGGYLDHVTELANIAFALFDCMHMMRPLPFIYGDALLVLFLHDIEKPWKYERGEDGALRHKPQFASKADDHAFRAAKIAEYGFALTPEHERALKYVEGEFGDYSNRHRATNELGAFCHMCDVASARIWYDCPKEKDDPWKGAVRVANLFENLK